jgi:hypothetical protein
MSYFQIISESWPLAVTFMFVCALAVVCWVVKFNRQNELIDRKLPSDSRVVKIHDYARGGD